MAVSGATLTARGVEEMEASEAAKEAADSAAASGVREAMEGSAELGIAATAGEVAGAVGSRAT
jgi:hypothetical protein